jgi:hypothetical protein
MGLDILNTHDITQCTIGGSGSPVLTVQNSIEGPEAVCPGGGCSRQGIRGRTVVWVVAALRLTCNMRLWRGQLCNLGTDGGSMGVLRVKALPGALSIPAMAVPLGC